ncbi:ATP-binding protein [Actinomadura craniellae]|uniref:ATP-binding protein n=1 Tax=Actinomadura craniellae TaxID=2231787 RepID=A0A365H2L4_9ACTN|nr:ATP-binding protein [Actinomadura craniellae]RAY13345.1 ATP-binding protein [Actinomadura craniellae]
MSGIHHLGAAILPAAPEQAATARRLLAAWLGPGCPVRDDAVLLLSEAFTNAVRHSTGDKVEVRARRDGHTVRVEVIDGGGPTVPHRVDVPCSEGGRGIPIIEALAHRHGWERVAQGLKVWFELS